MFRLRAPPTSIAAIAAVGLSACLALRPQLPDNIDRVRKSARKEWLEYGTCGEHALRRCETGHQLLTASDSYQYWTTAYDEHGRLEFEVMGGCMGMVRRSGDSPECPAERSTLVRDLCEESLVGLESRGLELQVTCASPARVVVPAGQTFVELVDGARLRFVVPAAPREPFEVFFEGAPPGVSLKSCDRFNDCVALDAGALLTSQVLFVASPGAEKPCDFWVSRSFLFRSGDAGVENAK